MDVEDHRLCFIVPFCILIYVIYSIVFPHVAGTLFIKALSHWQKLSPEAYFIYFSSLVELRSTIFLCTISYQFESDEDLHFFLSNHCRCTSFLLKHYFRFKLLNLQLFKQELWNIFDKFIGRLFEAKLLFENKIFKNYTW